MILKKKETEKNLISGQTWAEPGGRGGSRPDPTTSAPGAVNGPDTVTPQDKEAQPITTPFGNMEEKEMRV